MQGIKKIIKDVVRNELKLHDEYIKLKAEVELQRGNMWKSVHTSSESCFYDDKLNEILKKSNEATYKMYEGWFNDAVKKLKEFEEKEYGQEKKG